MAIFGQKPSLNPFGKMSIFRLFQLLVFIAQTVVFFGLQYRKRQLPGPYCLKNKVGKMAIFGQKPWVNPFEKMSIFRLFQLPVFIAQKGERYFSGLYCLKKKVGKMAIFGKKNHGLTPLEKCQFFYFFKLLFLYPKKTFFRCRIS